MRASRQIPLLAAAALLGGGWRLYLAAVYAGWEESDYGNLAMVRGVLDGRFLHYDMSHMPGYYALGALALAATGDAVVAARAVSWLGGMAALLLACRLTARVEGTLALALAALLLCLQPEFSLYAASSLREPVYAAFVVGMLAALSRERLALAGLCAGLAFFVRFDGVLALGPAMLLHALGRPGRLQRLGHTFGPLLGCILLWSVYCRIDHGTFLFWSHAVSVNVETGLGAEAVSTAEWLWAGTQVSGTLLAWVLPWRIGWGVWAALIASLLLVPWRRHGLERTWAVLGLGMLGVWGGIGFVGQHSPEHNLYWKWLCPIIPVIVPLGVIALLRLTRRLQPAARAAVLALVVAQAVISGLAETHRQWALSEDWYRPQLDLAQQIEAEIPESVPLLLDNIPACWLDRRHHGWQLTSWFDVPSAPGDEADFARWLAAEQIGWVLWFREDWTQAPHVAPFLAQGGVWEAPGGQLRLVERGREDGYGWIWFEVLSTPSSGGQ